MVFHVEKGSYGDITLDGLNVALAIHTPGRMEEGNLVGWGPTSSNAPTTSRPRRSARSSPVPPAGPWRPSPRSSPRTLGRRRRRSPSESRARSDPRKSRNILHIQPNRSRRCTRAGRCGSECRASGQSRQAGHGRGIPGSTFTDHGMRWDNSGKNGHYAPIRWSNHYTRSADRRRAAQDHAPLTCRSVRRNDGQGCPRKVSAARPRHRRHCARSADSTGLESLRAMARRRHGYGRHGHDRASGWSLPAWGSWRPPVRPGGLSSSRSYSSCGW